MSKIVYNSTHLWNDLPTKEHLDVGSQCYHFRKLAARILDKQSD